MFPKGKTTVKASCVQVRQRIDAKPSKDMIPHKRGLNTEAQAMVRDRRRGHIQRLNSAPGSLHCPELPPIVNNTVKSSLIEKRSRPLTPLVVSSGRTSSATSRSLPKNYRINLDLTPLVEVGTSCDVPPFERKRQTSVDSDLELSSDSFVSSNSPKLRSLSSSPKPRMDLGRNEASSKSRSTYSAESLEEPEGEDDSPLLEEDGKDKMILRWLQSIERHNNDITSPGELLPSIKEGRPT